MPSCYDTLPCVQRCVASWLHGNNHQILVAVDAGSAVVVVGIYKEFAIMGAIPISLPSLGYYVLRNPL